MTRSVRIAWLAAVGAAASVGQTVAGLDRARLDAWRDELARLKTSGLVVMRRGEIVYEWYAAGWSADKPHGTASLAKALVGGMSLVVAISDGAITADDVASKYIPAWRDDPLKSKITVRQLATHTSGIE